ncbi:hypothetical protein P8C59_006508 [Phyllachora maydis]|uniref:Uncharacterized protein n=1 Tax=Phyllachora maydis TaxID=1825666 RepID=A0AAD9MGT8_9PEZI|nr:hypothetical protein P8C59_006508 [Phyllachora maydis]
MLAKPAKIILAIRRVAACKAKRRKSAKAYATAGRAAYKLAKKEDLRRSKRTISSNASRYTTNSGLIANKDDNNAYNGAYIPPAKAEEEEEKDSSSNNNSVNSSTSNSTDKGKGSSICKYSEGTSRCKDILLSCLIVARYLKVLTAFKPASASAIRYVLILSSSSKEEADLVGMGKEAL